MRIPQGCFVDKKEVVYAFDFLRHEHILPLAVVRGLYSQLESLKSLMGSRIQPFSISMSIEDLQRRAREDAEARVVLFR